MMIVGIIVLVGALAAIGAGVWQWRKLKMIGGAPMVKTAELVGNASETGLISVEGNIEMPNPLIAPCSGRPCVYYEIIVTQQHEEQVRTENGIKKKRGKRTVKHEKVGGQFYINDGSGPAKVDASEAQVNGSMEKSFKQDGPASGYLTFGQYQINVPPHGGNGYAIGTNVTEKIIPAEGSAYVAGRLEGDTIMRKKNMGGKLLIAKEGAEALQKATKRKAIGSAAAAAIMVPGGGAMAAMGDMPSGSGSSCSELVGDPANACTGRQRDSSPVEFTWTVQEAATYTVEAHGTGTDPTYRLYPDVTIRDAAGGTALHIAGGSNGTMGNGVFAPGTYTVSVTDTSAGWASTLEGGAGFSFNIDMVPGSNAGGAPAPGAVDPAAGGAIDPNKPE